MCNKIPRPHAELIKAWADGAVIQYKGKRGEWKDVNNNNPTWNDWEEYRVKPEPRPDVVKYGIAALDVNKRAQVQHLGPFNSNGYNIVLTFDGETGKLKKAEVIA